MAQATSWAFFILGAKPQVAAVTRAEIDKLRRKGDRHMYDNFGPVENKRGHKKGRKK